MIARPPPLVNLVVLAGGAGQRLDPTGRELPKHLRTVGDAPLMLSATQQQIDELRVQRVVFRVAHRSEEFFRRWTDDEFAVSVPSSILVGRLSDGPIGALADTSHALRGQTVLFTGGDVFYAIEEFGSFLEFHHSHDAPISVGVARSVPSQRPSTLSIGRNHELAGFERKASTTSEDLINASFYLVDSARIDWLIEDYWRAKATSPGVQYKEDELWQLVLRRPDRARIFQLPGTVVNVNRREQLLLAQELAVRSA